MKRKTSYNYRNLFMLISTAPQQIYTMYFIKNHEILLIYFNELETQTPWKHMFSCLCEDCISYFGEPDAV